MRTVAWTAVLVALGGGAIARGDDRPSTQTGEGMEARSTAELARLLGSANYAERQSATEELLRRGPGVYDELKEAFKTSRSYEARRRMRQVVRAIYLEEALGPPTAFLGIQYSQMPVSDPRAPADGDAVRVTDVIPRTAADAAGVRPGDLIVKLNGRPIPADENRQGFASWISQQRPGAECEVTVYRGEELLTLRVRLGRRPMHLGPSVRADPDRFTLRAAEFTRWWRQEFDPEGIVAGDTPSAEDPQWRLDSTEGRRPAGVAP